ncbi:phosphotransferase family protein [Tenuibacillus multivorans]|uniref:Predicted kinase, aminoglycoside phosphotransferase (APT) family n=1 Tax=Tenuibacillus multivorans TaxID=237069 RepID=A0A1H0FKM5_9BACI|nr:phosphotransferase [Tenuibacillus multivorans]GEL77700.1 aminoglycoside phosphotransferase [Tenuibacillus multivorans]SDN95019.1 Predicted kinase, aminoglycoside phosphotransferase (APT) family [Tenuibacillus multivorans]
MEKIINQIGLESIESTKKIHKGFSNDEKYIINQRYLLRIFPNENIDERQREFAVINKCSKLSRFVPKAFEFGEMEGRGYMLLEFLPGEDGEDALGKLSEEEQYQAGYQAGVELRKLHQIEAPENHDWFSVKKAKTERYFNRLTDVTFDESLKDMLKNYIKRHEHLMKGRPSTLQHDDFHPANLLIHQKKFVGIIDFQRVDFGDPLYDLHKLGFFSKPISIPFTRGNIAGYFHNDIPQSFWDLYGLYSAMHVVSAVVWGEQFDAKQAQFLRDRAMEVIVDHDYFKLAQPIWAEGL